uniref:Diphthamide biosynthesis protein 3 n=1 Tax=Ditylum brightwellii TaxID=49249 RepID=A0A6S8YW78_9STRA|mmetsp:Transcript_34546/g.46298  ORF Transcript_34546/g.46298 Transcript_34546/m.46298 type:complete len:110 (-) Transcript_34546:1036-1365(-)
MSIYEEIEIEDLDYDPNSLTYTYPCPCGDKFRITLEELWDGEDVATCPSCTLRIMVIYEEDDLPELPDDYDEEDEDYDETADEDVEDEEEKKADEEDIVTKAKSLSVKT